MPEPISELEMQIWAVCWSKGIWPQFGFGVTYEEAVAAQKLATKNHADETFSITTAEAARRWQDSYERRFNKKRDVETTETI